MRTHPDRTGQTCQAKVTYFTRTKAEHQRQTILARRGEPMRVYGCPDCGYFHLTSKTYTQQEADL